MKSITLFFIILFLAISTFGQGIDTTISQPIGGIEQIFKIKGEDSSKPILLYLHGAGNSNYSLIDNAEKLTSKLQDHFVVVLWDQREFGKTLQKNKSTQTINVDLKVNDTKELIDYLRKTFNRKKLYLVGHSMGSVMGISIAHKYPDLLYALVEMSPPVSGVESQKIALNLLKAHFKKVNNQRAIQELKTVQTPTTDFEQQFIQYTWQCIYDGENITDAIREEVKPILKKITEETGELYNEIYRMDYFKLFPSLNCPVYFFTGRKDFSTNSTITEKYYKKVKAPKKALFWFEKSAHNLPDTEPELMQETIINKVFPTTIN